MLQQFKVWPECLFFTKYILFCFSQEMIKSISFCWNFEISNRTHFGEFGADFQENGRKFHKISVIFLTCFDKACDWTKMPSILLEIGFKLTKFGPIRSSQISPGAKIIHFFFRIQNQFTWIQEEIHFYFREQIDF